MKVEAFHAKFTLNLGIKNVGIQFWDFFTDNHVKELTQITTT